jgi:arylsulfatase A-like enzyme
MKMLVIVARGVRAGALGPYGNPWLDTPCLDVLATDGIVFDWHYADRADPAGARAAWRSGRYRLSGPDAPVARAGADLLAGLREKGVFSWLLVDGRHHTPEEFTEGWDEAEQVAPSEEETPLEATVAAVRSVLKTLAGRGDWLLWVELSTALPPWEPPDEFREPYFAPEELEIEEEEDDEEDVEDDEEAEEVEEVDEEVEVEEPEEEEEPPLEWMDEPPTAPTDPEDDRLFLSLHSSYGAAVSYLDAGIGAVLEALDESGEEALVVVTSDHGLPLGEHGTAGVANSHAHEELTHLPLLLRLPGKEGAGRHVAALTQSLDLAPTVAAWFGASLPEAQGHDLLPLARRQTLSVRPYACSAAETEGKVSYSLRTPEWALLATRPGEGPARLFVKPDDSWEVNDVAAHHLELAEQLERALLAFVEAAALPGPLTPPPLESP